MNSYEQKLEARRVRLIDRAEKRRRESASAYKRAHDMASVIPFGQPILVGHHSEKRDRNYRARIHDTFGKAFEADKEARELEGRAASVGTGGISSDDPEAVLKLKAELAEKTQLQDRMKAANKAIRKNDDAALAALGFSPRTIEELKKPDSCGRIGFADYQISNNGANLRRIEQRIKHLEAQSGRESSVRDIGNSGLKIVENVEANRLQIVFPGKPSAEVRQQLKKAGFRWAPSEGAWQRHLGNNARWQAEQIIKALP